MLVIVAGTMKTHRALLLLAIPVTLLLLAGCGAGGPQNTGEGAVEGFDGTAPDYTWPVALSFSTVVNGGAEETTTLITGTLSPAQTSTTQGMTASATVTGGVVEGTLAPPDSIDPDSLPGIATALCQPPTVEPQGVKTSGVNFMWDAKNDEGASVGLLLHGVLAETVALDGFTVGDRLMGFVYADAAATMSGTCQVGGEGGGLLAFDLELVAGWNLVEARVEALMSGVGDIGQATVTNSDHEGGTWNWYLGGALVSLTTSPTDVLYEFRDATDGSTQAFGTSSPVTIALPPKTYSLCVMADGYANYFDEAIVMSIGEALDISVSLDPGVSDPAACAP